MWTGTEKAVADLMIAPRDDARLYRKVAFVLSPSAASRYGTEAHVGKDGDVVSRRRRT
jgi:hypothetical protein